jgi:hypothetical protein
MTNDSDAGPGRFPAHRPPAGNHSRAEGDSQEPTRHTTRYSHNGNHSSNRDPGE